MAIYVYTDEFIREPWENTVAYYPLKEDFNDASGNNKHLSTYTWNPSIVVKDWVSCAYYNWSSVSKNTSISAPISWRTIMARVNYSTSGQRIMWVWSNVSSDGDYGKSWLQLNTSLAIDDSQATYWTQQTKPNWWFLVCLTQSWSTCSQYINWELKQTLTNMPINWTSASWIMVVLWSKSNYNYSEKYTWYISNVIVENKARTDQEVADYFNKTKSGYWIQ